MTLTSTPTFCRVCIEPQEDNPNNPAPPGMGPYVVEVVNVPNDEHVYCGGFAPLDLLKKLENVASQERLVAWLAKILLDQEDYEPSDKLLEAWLADENVTVKAQGRPGFEWPKRYRPLVEWAERANADIIALDLDQALPVSTSKKLPRARV